MRVLVVGATGMLGYSLFKNLNDAAHLEVYGTVRSINGKEKFFSDCDRQIFKGIGDLGAMEAVLKNLKPTIVINCIGLIKQLRISKQHIDAITVNSLLPHQLAQLCENYSSKLIHFSTDCVFDGKKGGYIESDVPNALDIYGRSKCLGEVDYAPHLTLRTSIIGHELVSSVSLIDWFLAQEGSVKGFSKAIFSGLPTCVIARLLVDKILPNEKLSGLYHLSVDSIDKLSLLNIVSEVYAKEIQITESNDLEINRSLNSDRLRKVLDLEIPSWEELVLEMKSDYLDKYLR